MSILLIHYSSGFHETLYFRNALILAIVPHLAYFVLQLLARTENAPIYSHAQCVLLHCSIDAVYSPSRRECLQGAYVPVPMDSAPPSSAPDGSGTSTGAVSGYLASLLTSETGCGSTDTAWLIDAGRGQTVILTLYDFGTPRYHVGGANASRQHLSHVSGIISEVQVCERDHTNQWTLCDACMCVGGVYIMCDRLLLM